MTKLVSLGWGWVCEYGCGCGCGRVWMSRVFQILEKTPQPKVEGELILKNKITTTTKL